MAYYSASLNLHKGTIMKYLVKNLLNGSLQVVVAVSETDALKEGIKVFKEPNRNNRDVLVLREVT